MSTVTTPKSPAKRAAPTARKRGGPKMPKIVTPNSPPAPTALGLYEEHVRERQARATAEKRKVATRDVDVNLLRAAMKENPDNLVMHPVEEEALEDARLAALKDPERGKGMGVAEAKAASEASKARKSSGPVDGPSSEAKPKSSVPRYPEEIREASKRARDLLGGKHAPGPKQHVAVRKVIGDRDPVEVAGVPAAALKKFAQTGELAKDKRGNLGDIAEKVGDPWARGRSLAAILTALIEGRRA